MLTGGGGDNELVAVERGECRSVGAEKLQRLLDDRLEHGHRIELGREQAPRARQLLRERPRGPLRLEQTAAVERSARSAGDLLRELEILARELPRLAEEHEHERRPLARHGDREERRERAAPPGVVKALVAGQRRGRKHLTVVGRLQQRSRHLELPDRLRERVASDKDEIATGLHEHGSEVPAERFGRSERRGVVGLDQRQRLAEQGRDPVEAALHSGLPCGVRKALGVAKRERRERRECLEHLDVAIPRSAASRHARRCRAHRASPRPRPSARRGHA